jgi:hypothetical protein
MLIVVVSLVKSRTTASFGGGWGERVQRSRADCCLGSGAVLLPTAAEAEGEEALSRA